jgi:hypothetical protein
MMSKHLSVLGAVLAAATALSACTKDREVVTSTERTTVSGGMAAPTTTTTTTKRTETEVYK